MKIYTSMHNNLDTQYLTIITIFGYALFVVTFQALVGVFTLIAATTTAFWNIYKFIMDRKDRKRISENESKQKINKNE